MAANHPHFVSNVIGLLANFQGLTDCLNRAELYVTVPEFVGLLMYLITSCVRVNIESRECSDDKIDQIMAHPTVVAWIQEEANKLNDTSRVCSVDCETCQDRDFATCSVETATIHLNMNWLIQMESTIAKNNAHPDNALISAINVNLALLVLKLFHEYVNSLTPAILVADHNVRKQIARLHPGWQIKTDRKTSTPRKLGMKFKKGGNIGDMGFEAEEYLCGARTNRGPVEEKKSWKFSSIAVYVYEPTNEFEYRVFQNEAAWAAAITTSAVPTLADFTMQLQVPAPGGGRKRKSTRKSSPAKLCQHNEESTASSEYDASGFSRYYGFLEGDYSDADARV